MRLGARTIKGDIDSINHVGLIVLDFEAAVAFFEAIGFILSPLSMHKGSLKPGEPEVPFGTGNRCATFRHNYFELLAHVHKDRYDFFVPEFLKRFEGAHIIVFGCGDAQVVHRRLAGAGLETSGVIRLERDLETPDGAKTAQFDCIHYPRTASPEGLVQAAHHLTPELIHQPRFLDHPNRTVALREVILCSDDPDRDERRYAEFLGREAERDGPKRVFTLPLVSRRAIVGAQDLNAVLPGCVAPDLPFLAGSVMATEDMDAVRSRLRLAEIAHGEFDATIVVPAEIAFGHTLVFEPA